MENSWASSERAKEAKLEDKIEELLIKHEDELDDMGGMMSSGPKTHTIAPFIVDHFEEIEEIIKGAKE